MRIPLGLRLAMAALMGVALTPIGSWTAAASDLVVAQQTTVNGYGYVHNVSGGSKWAQTFVPATSGSLNKVTLTVDGVAHNSNANLVVEIQATTAGLPNGTTLATVSVPPGALPGTVTTFDFTFTSPATVQALSTYAIVVYSAATNSGYGVGMNTAGGYSSGTVAYADWTSGWTVGTGDLYFIAYASVDSTGSSSNPPDIQEAFGIPADGSCNAVPAEVRTNIADRTTGWGKSWTNASWRNNGAGGEICVRTLRYDSRINGFAAIS